MAIQRKPHIVFGIYWALWTLASIWAAVGAVGTTRLWLWGAFFVAEIAGVAIKWRYRDTLSETWTWAYKHLVGTKPDGNEFGRGWNAMLLAYLATLGWNVADSLHAGGMPWIPAGAIGVLVAIGMHDHWSDPTRWG